ncbi:MAG: hypothetical protein D6820_18865 [Lentisphaerae bacterium]|nr:MAG: hypothetical protein D6820_18865 [Lentisphaerota bacterium]
MRAGDDPCVVHAGEYSPAKGRSGRDVREPEAMNVVGKRRVSVELTVIGQYFIPGKLYPCGAQLDRVLSRQVFIANMAADRYIMAVGLQ